ncbi:MAG: hypothetical protein LBT44_07875 [Clostridiales bacterium]|nr:hypothetical protein [Clostridiales bacterium]
MKSLTVCTEAYFNELDAYTVCFVRRAKKRDAGVIKLYFGEFDAAPVYQLLDWICFQKNPVLKHEPKLAAIIREAIPAAITDKNIQALCAYAAENYWLHLEGYVRFRMADYNDYLNRLLYSIAKKLKL